MNSKDNKPLGRCSSAFALSASIMVAANTLLACAKDQWAGFNKFMASLTGHHWSAQALVIILGFLLIGLILSRYPGLSRANPLVVIRTLAVSAVVSSFALLLWYLFF